MMNKDMQQQEIKKQEAEIEQFYRAKYPNSIGRTEPIEAEIKLSVREVQAQNQAFSDGMFRANQAANADMLAKLQDAFGARNGGKA
jgi:hypothetical protein